MPVKHINHNNINIDIHVNKIDDDKKGSFMNTLNIHENCLVHRRYQYYERK